jgi:hypothetical protein
VIESVEIKNLRGIREGRLNQLTPLTVLVGPNSSGKSTVLDALLIAASLSPGDAVGKAVNRRATRDADARWLLWRQGHGDAWISVKAEGHHPRLSVLSWSLEVPRDLAQRLRESKKDAPSSCIHTRSGHPSSYNSNIVNEGVAAWTAFAADNSYEVSQNPDVLPDDLKIEPAVRAPNKSQV